MAAEQRDIIEFVPEDGRGVSSDEFIAPVQTGPAVSSPIEIPEEKSMILRELDSIELPRMEHRDRARLQMQSPNRLYFYWSVAPNPFRKLNRALGGGIADYTLVVKLLNLDRETEEVYRIEDEGSYWFNVTADQRYRAEIGFYSTSRPYIRVLFSNTVTTPRKNPSRRTADVAHWKVTSDRFAKILDVSGFSQDAFDVALAGDEPQTADELSRVALAQLTGERVSYAELEPHEIRLALLLLASGAIVESLRPRISARLFAIIADNIDKFDRDAAYRVMSEHFDLDDDADFDAEEIGPAVYGASLLSFPRRLRTRGRVPAEYAPVSSFPGGGR